ncbi:cytochrome-c peroxidase [Schlesneria paludicola]|uniref:cytochrome-c peroxidase n=1 Tax=Schlesneria paludicola TaxID=360056 RepID=UPI00029A33B4|nr:cytochrome c peroxidase [Schlesneria paludicola]
MKHAAWLLVFGVLVTAAQAEDAGRLTVELGTPELTAGIPGEGPLTTEQIRKWLDNKDNFKELDVILPMGLSLGANNISIPKDNPLTKAKIELGRQLFFDTRLSADNTIACANCHHPEDAYGRNTRFGEGIGGQIGGRNSPVAYNRILSTLQFWDGRAGSLEDQAVGPIANPIEMGHTHDACVTDLGKIEGYKLQFDKIFPGKGINIKTVGAAIASFERVLVTGPSPADYLEPLLNFKKAFKDDLKDLAAFKKDDPDSYALYWKVKRASDAHPVSASAARGRELFFGKANCTACHAGANFTDEKFHNLGVGMSAKMPDLGRYDVTKVEKDKGAFKTPTVRNVASTGPYMHDGSLKTLEEVVEWYDKGGEANSYLSDKMKKLNLTTTEKEDLVAYMLALHGDLTPVRSDRLPK